MHLLSKLIKNNQEYFTIFKCEMEKKNSRDAIIVEVHRLTDTIIDNLS